jgi:hypothetical protein
VNQLEVHVATLNRSHKDSVYPVAQQCHPGEFYLAETTPQNTKAVYAQVETDNYQNFFQ